jgi:hypothetical protein
LAYAQATKGRGFFLSHLNETNLILMGPQGFHQAINPISRQAEDGIHVPINECLDKNIGCGHDLYSQSLRTNRGSKHQKVNLLSRVARLREGKTSGIASTMLI